MLENPCIDVKRVPVIGNMTFKIDNIVQDPLPIIKKYKINETEVIIINWDGIPIALEYEREKIHIVKGYDAPTSFMTNVEISIANPNSQLKPRGQPSQPPIFKKESPPKPQHLPRHQPQKPQPQKPQPQKPQPPPGPQPQKPQPPPKGGRPNTLFCNARCKDGHTCKNKKATCMWHNKKSILHKRNAKTK